MSNKATCPACGSRTSSLWALLYGDGAGLDDSCPGCGLSVDAMREVLAARERGANKDLTEKYEALLIRVDVAEREARELRQVVADVRSALGPAGATDR